MNNGNKLSNRLRLNMKTLISVTIITLCVNPFFHAEPVSGQNEILYKKVIAGNTVFAIDLYHNLSTKTEGNIFFSPLSMTTALVMATEGAGDETAIEMGNVLKFPPSLFRQNYSKEMNPWNMQPIHESISVINQRLMAKDPAETSQIRREIDELRQKYETLNAKIEKLRQAAYTQDLEPLEVTRKEIAEKLNNLVEQVDQYEIRIANAMWGEKTYPFRTSYMETIQKYYSTGSIIPVNFIHKYEKARKQINSWVESHTAERIKNLFPFGSVDEDTRLILVNAIYFKGEWAVPFDDQATEHGYFTLSDGSQVMTSIMHGDTVRSARYAAFNADGSYFETPYYIDHYKSIEQYPESDGFSMVELPYKGDELSMVIIAPDRFDKFDSLEEKLNFPNLDNWLNRLEERKVNILLPKFKLEAEYKMNETLKSMGILRAFINPHIPNGAQFPGMTYSKDSAQKLYITQVRHKAFIEVNEKGTEAAAATGVSLSVTSMPQKTLFIPTFKADRPFIFLIRDRVTGSILFIGRMMNPVE